MQPLTALTVFALFAAGQPQGGWDLAKCRQTLTEAHAAAGHVCTPDHLDADLAKLLKETSGPIDATLLPFVRELALGGLAESGEAVTKSREAAKKAERRVRMWAKVEQQYGPPASGSSGSQLLDLCEHNDPLCLGYISGAADVLALYGLIVEVYEPDPEPGAPERPRPFCSPVGATYGQFQKVVVKFLREHPERLHERRRTLVEDALRLAFPCPTE